MEGVEKSIAVCHYGVDDLIERTNSWENSSHKKSEFDKILTTKWKKCETDGVLKYSLSECKYKVLQRSECKETGFVAQLNLQRGFNRRKREAFESMNDAFTNDQFNFTKIKSKEILFELIPGENTAPSLCNQSNGKLSWNGVQSTSNAKNCVAVNISPIDDCHILLLPQLEACHPQRMTLVSLLLAFDMTQLSYHPGFRVGFNSLHAWASVNHLHYHAMYFDYQLYIDDIVPGKKLTDRCHLIQDDVIMPGFLFTVPIKVDERIKVAEEIIGIVDFLHEMEVPYTLTITRSPKFSSTRAFLWPRKSTKGLGPSPCFDVACIEVAGHFPIKTESEFTNLTFDGARDVLKETSVDEETLENLIFKIKSTYCPST